ncbi:Rab geranylgeranyltransferase [Metarhizium acridum]|uniref:Rab geranylgeranyltransferase n=1 Tax=Metarhizium acridum TaxID=92637 RepID=UPI001C6CD481|nr:Rab geranylgeranyltransferase [Metarhizium acridum]
MATHGVARVSRPRSQEQRRQDLSKIQVYRDLEAQIRTCVASEIYDSRLFQLTTDILHLNPEYYTVWNIRRRCLLSSLLSQGVDPFLSDAPVKLPDACQSNNQDPDKSVLEFELTFLIPLLKRAPKCYWIWEYRRWILTQTNLRLSIPAARQIWELELSLTSSLLGRDRRNFHAWGYRRFVVAQLESDELGGKSLAEDEFAYTDKMIRGDLSNFSAWHNRGQVILRIVEERGFTDEARAALLVKELHIIWEGLNIGADDQSLWYYHRFLISQITNSGTKKTIAPALTIAERVTHLKHEIAEVEDLLGDYANVELVYEALLEYTFALERLVKRNARDGREQARLLTWLAKLQVLDPMRAGRWRDMERGIRGI